MHGVLTLGNRVRLSAGLPNIGGVSQKGQEAPAFNRMVAGSQSAAPTNYNSIMNEPNFSPRGVRMYDKRHKRKQACRKALRHDDRAAVVVLDPPLAAGILMCPVSLKPFCKDECCNPEFDDSHDDEPYDYYYESCFYDDPDSQIVIGSFKGYRDRQGNTYRA